MSKSIYTSFLIAMLSCISNAQIEDETIQKTFIDSVWVANKVSFDLHTIGNKQFVAYYNKYRMMTLASRELGSENWEKKVLPNKLHWDSHNYVVLAFDKEGHIHVSGNMHVDPLVYFKSEKPYDIHSVKAVTTMTGENENRVTYPKFFHDKNDNLFYSYRTGGSGNGNVWVNRYDVEDEKWEQYLTEGLFKGIIGDTTRSAYHNLSRGPDGNFHYIWMWRWTPEVETCHQLCYAKTSDFKNWKNAQGESISLPFTPDNKKLIVDDVPSKGGLHNSKYRMTFLKDGSPIIGYIKYDAQGLTQLYLSRFEQGAWLSKTISNWNFRWKFIGGGDKMTKGASFDFVKLTEAGNMVIDWSTEKGETGTYVIDANTFEPSDEQVSIKPKYSFKTHQRITNDPSLSVNIQDGKSNSKTKGTKYVLKWESREKSHGRHAPKVVPEGPLSALFVLEVD